MSELFNVKPHQFGDASVQTVDARELHTFLEVGSAFKDWVARRIADYGFTEGQDFCSFLSESHGGRPSKEYAISLDMAKELAMVERNDKGKQARQYFIECERRLKSQTPTIPQTMPEALRLAAQALEDAQTARAAQVKAEVMLQLEAKRSGQLEAQVAETAPKAAALDRIASTDGSFCITDAAKNLQIPPRQFTAKLCQLGWIYRRPMSATWLAHQDKINQLVLEHKVTTGEKSTGGEWTNTQVRVTAKGMAKLALIFEKEVAA